jgi:hypothetical protein
MKMNVKGERERGRGREREPRRQGKKNKRQEERKARAEVNNIFAERALAAPSTGVCLVRMHRSKRMGSELVFMRSGTPVNKERRRMGTRLSSAATYMRIVQEEASGLGGGEELEEVEPRRNCVCCYHWPF